MRTCPICSADMSGRRPNAVYCGDTCKDRARYETKRRYKLGQTASGLRRRYLEACETDGLQPMSAAEWNQAGRPPAPTKRDMTHA